MAAQIKADYRRAKLDRKTQVILDYAIMVTRNVHEVNQTTIKGLREVGWLDEEILTATHIIGFFNYYARLVDALGVEPEDFMLRSRQR